MQVPNSWDLPNEIKHRFGLKGAGHQRAMIAEGHLLLILHVLPMVEDLDGRNLPSKGHQLTKDHDLILGHRKPVFFWRKPSGGWRCNHNASGLKSLQRHLESYSVAQAALNDRLAMANCADDFFLLLQEIAPVELAAKNLHGALQAAREGISEDRNIIDLRDWAREIERSLSLLYTSTKTALDFYMARKSEEQARLSAQSIRVATRLNLLAALFFPLTAIASLFGMNLMSGFERAPGLFWLVLLVGIAAGTMTQRWVLRSKP